VWRIFLFSDILLVTGVVSSNPLPPASGTEPLAITDIKELISARERQKQVRNYIGFYAFAYIVFSAFAYRRRN
jgi:hypothetical protein